MAQIPYNSHIDLGNNEIQNAKFQMLASAPNAAEAKFYYDTTLKKFGYYNGTEWIYGTVYTNGTGILINGNVISVDTSVIATVAALQGYVPTSREINGKALSTDIDLTASDVGALPDTTTINDLTTTAQQNALNSGATTAKINQISTNQSDITTINSKIPAEATSTNKLADKAYVDNSIQTNSAHFRGNWATWSAVPTTSGGYPADDDGNTTPTTNDYMVVQNSSDYPNETLVGAWQFVYTGTWATNGKAGWLPKFQINEEPLTPAQQAALDSGANATNIAQIGTNTSSINTINGQITTINTTLATKAETSTATNPALTSSGGVCTWRFVNPLLTDEAVVSVYRVSDGVQVMTEVDVSEPQILVKFNSTNNISADTYRVVMVGLA